MRAREGYPDAETIDRMDEALAWLLWIENPRVRTVVSARAAGAKWARIAKSLGWSRRTTKRRWMDGLAIIADRVD